MQKTIFLDRDGVINIDYGYVYKWEDFKFINGVICALQNLIKLKYKIIIVTNQSGIGRGLYTEEDYFNLTKKYVRYLNNHNIDFLDIYHCPHSTDSFGNPTCFCRKPLPGMFKKASNDHNIKLSDTIMLGDKISDIKAAKSAGIKNRYLISNDCKLILESKDLIKKDFKTLLEFADFLKSKN